MSDQSTGQYLRSVRLQLGLTQVELAQRLGVSNVSVNRWEHDRVRPDHSTLDRYRRLELGGRDALSGAAETGNLPVPATGIVGREQHLRDIVELRDDRQFVTVLGAGGAGKTRLAIAVG